MVNRPLIRPYLLGAGGILGRVPLDSHVYFVGISWVVPVVPPPLSQDSSGSNIYLFVQDQPSPADACMQAFAAVSSHRFFFFHPPKKKSPKRTVRPGTSEFLLFSRGFLKYNPDSLGLFFVGRIVHCTPSRYVLLLSRWWFQIFFIFNPTWGKIPILTNIFQVGWNHQLGYCCWWQFHFFSRIHQIHHQQHLVAKLQCKRKCQWRRHGRPVASICMYAYIYLEPKWLLFWLEKALFWRVDLQK